VINNKITDPSHADSRQNYDFTLEGEENNANNTSDTSVSQEVAHRILCGHWDFLHLSREALKILFPFATTHQCETGF
jgi:hypothetical protein